MKNLIFLIILFLIALPVKGERPAGFSTGEVHKLTAPARYDTLLIPHNWYVPDYIKLQYAGLIGFMSLGVGYEVTPRYEPTLYYGLLSRDFGGSTRTVHTISLKNSWKLFKPGLLGDFIPKAGFSVNLGFTNNTFYRLPAHYPNNYYFQNRLHVAPFWGGEWGRSLGSSGPFRAIGMYAEMSTLDNYVLELIRARYVSIDKIWNLSFGITVYLD